MAMQINQSARESTKQTMPSHKEEAETAPKAAASQMASQI